MRLCLARRAAQDVPEDSTVGYHVDFVWKSTSFDRMRAALSTLEKDRACISAFLLQTLLGAPSLRLPALPSPCRPFPHRPPANRAPAPPLPSE